MKINLTALFCLGAIWLSFSQEIIELPHQTSSEVTWTGGEKSYYSEDWQNPVVTNVSVPTIQVFKPEEGEANGTSVIVAPGGGLFALSIESEGTAVAKWLNEKGITAFVLKYRLVPTAEDGAKEITQLGASNPSEIGRRVAPVMPLSVQDGLAAVAYVRSNSDSLGVAADKIGFMGFSAGGAVTMGVTMNYKTENRPDFIVPVYPWMTVVGPYEVPTDAPPMLVVCATDDPLGLAGDSATLYTAWFKAGKRVGLHMYSKGGHGFGMKSQGLPSDRWIDRFYDWALAEGLTSTSK